MLVDEDGVAVGVDERDVRRTFGIVVGDRLADFDTRSYELGLDLAYIGEG